MRNPLKIGTILSEVYSAGPGAAPPDGAILDIMPVLLEKVIPLHQVIPVDIYLPGCPPDPERIWAAITMLLKGEPVALPVEMRNFG
jgi:NAD-reducing hydrogenase small subunit